jgi:hypothetical protein
MKIVYHIQTHETQKSFAKTNQINSQHKTSHVTDEATLL